MKQCSFLSFALPDQIAYPGSTVYNFEESRYWSVQQQSNSPTCRFSPTDAVGVSVAVLALRVTQCKFAVKSGGHATFAGASNIDAGVTIDLINFNQVAVSANKKETAVGAGNIWHDVYNYLQPKGLTVIGGRVSAIGVGGLTTGGGMSFFSGRYGWACDNVNKYQVSSILCLVMSALPTTTRSYLQMGPSGMSLTAHTRTSTSHSEAEATTSESSHVSISPPTRKVISGLEQKPSSTPLRPRPN